MGRPAQEVAAEFAANEDEALQKETRQKLETVYDETVAEVMYNAKLSTDTGVGKDLYEWFMKPSEKDSNIKITMDKMGFEKIPADRAEATLLEIISSKVPDSEAAST